MSNPWEALTEARAMRDMWAVLVADEVADGGPNVLLYVERYRNARTAVEIARGRDEVAVNPNSAE